MLRRSIIGALIVCMATVSVGCGPKEGSGADAKPKDNKTTTPTSPTPKEDGDVTEAEAKAKLTAVLNSWSFGDTPEQFEKANPGIRVIEPMWGNEQVLGVKLVRFDIRSSRRSAENLAPPALGAIEYLVALQFQNRPEGASVTRTYKVQENQGGHWVVYTDKD